MFKKSPNYRFLSHINNILHCQEIVQEVNEVCQMKSTHVNNQVFSVTKYCTIVFSANAKDLAGLQ